MLYATGQWKYFVKWRWALASKYLFVRISINSHVTRRRTEQTTTGLRIDMKWYRHDDDVRRQWLNTSLYQHQYHKLFTLKLLTWNTSYNAQAWLSGSNTFTVKQGRTLRAKNSSTIRFQKICRRLTAIIIVFGLPFPITEVYDQRKSSTAIISQIWKYIARWL